MDRMIVKKSALATITTTDSPIAEETKQKQFRGNMGLGEGNGKSTDTVWSTNMGEEAKELDQAMSGYFPPVDSYIPGEEQDQAQCAGACPIRKPPSQPLPLVNMCRSVLLQT